MQVNRRHCCLACVIKQALVLQNGPVQTLRLTVSYMFSEPVYSLVRYYIPRTALCESLEVLEFGVFGNK